MRKLLLPILCCLFGMNLCANLSISLDLGDIHYLKKKDGSVKPTVFEGDSFELKVVISGTQQAPDDTEIEGLDQFVRRGKSTSSNVSINNASILAEKTTSYTLLPKKTGEFTIGPATVRYKGKVYTSNKVTLHISPQKERRSIKFQQKSVAGQEHELFCKLKSDKSTATTEEPVLVTLSIFQRGNIGKIQLVSPKFATCSVKEIKNASRRTEEINGKQHTVTEKKYLIFPQEPGVLKIPPIQVLYTIPSKIKRQSGFGFFEDSFFSEFFSGGMKQKSSATNTLSLKVAAPPATQKKVDGIGTFRSFTAKIDKTNVNANEPMKFTLELIGDANFDLIEAPKLTLPQTFKKYDSQTKMDQNLELGYTQGVKSFEFILQVPKAGTWTIQQQSFYYFDTKTKQYETLKTEPINITVTMPEGARPVAHPATKSNSTPSQLQAFSADIHFIEEDVPATQHEPHSIPFPLVLLLIFLIPMLFYSKPILLVLAPVYGKIPFFSSKKNILGVYQKKLTNAIEHNEFDMLYSLFTDFFAQNLGRPSGAINEEVMVLELRKRKLEKEKIDSFLTFLNECAQYSFAAGDQISNIDLLDVEKRANYWFLLLHQTLKKSGLNPPVGGTR